MKPERLARIQDLYHAAREREPGEVPSFLASACAGDDDLRREVESLLAADPAGACFLDEPLIRREAVASERTGSQDRLTPGLELGPYVIEAYLGAGGMGEVYRARDKRLHRTVALKVLPPRLLHSPGLRQRLEREARVVSSLNHPQICTLYDVGRQGEVDYLVMEYLEGETLRSLIARGPLPVARAVEIATQVVGGLEAAHAAGLVHRDLKPENINVSRGGQVKILDFGLAKQSRKLQEQDSTDLTTAHAVMGTAAYMSPEQVRGEELDYRSDLFSFGVVLYEMLCGKRAFPGASPVEVMNAILKEETAELPSSVPLALSRIVHRCLEKGRERRFQSAADLVFALQTLATPSPPGAGNKHIGTLWRAAVVSTFVLAAFASLLWFTHPLPPPRVTGTVQITPDGRENGAPMFTDGTRLFFNLGGEPRQVSVNGGEAVPLAIPMAGDAWPVNVSPDRTEFLLQHGYDIQGDLIANEIWAWPLLGGSPRRLGNLFATSRAELDSGSTAFPLSGRIGDDRAHESSAAWSPDGQQLVYAQDYDLHLARSDGTEIRKLISCPGYPFFVRWSPDGRVLRLSISRANDTQSSLWEVSLENGHMRRLLPGWDPSWYTCCGNWTADGKYYVFQSRRNLWAVREKGAFLRRASSEPVQLTTGPMFAYWPLPSVDGKRIFFEGYRDRTEFVRYDLESRRFFPVLAGVSGHSLVFSKDGKWVTYINLDGTLFRSTADGKERLQLTWPPFDVGMSDWSPDGKQIAFMGGPKGTPKRIYLVSFDGGPLRQLTHGESGERGDWDPSWSPDGSSLAFGATYFEKPANAAIRVVDLKTNRISVLPGSAGMWSPHWSPDGRFVAGMAEGGSEPFLYDLRTHKQTQLSDIRSASPGWSADGKFLYAYAELSIDAGWWYRVRVSDRKVEKLLDMHDLFRLFGGWFAVAPNHSLVMAVNAGTREIFALDWETP